MSVVMWDSLRAWWPEMLLSLGALATLCAGAWTKRQQPALTVAWAALAAAAWALWRSTVPAETAIFNRFVVCDDFSLAFRWLALGTTALITLMVTGSREVGALFRGEYYSLLLFIGVGLMVMAEAAHLLTAYLGIELVSLSSYALVGFLRDRRSGEAALKYLLFGALSSAIMLFGMSLLYGLTGQLGFAEIRESLPGLSGPMARALQVAVALLLAGVAFKISMVPFHMWTPDAYEGAPVPVAALLSVGPKAAGIALLVRLLFALHPAWPALAPLVLTLTILTMTLGNAVALVQSNVKRLLAYSTIGQVGYLLIGIVANTELGMQGVVLYLVAYLFMNLGAFACVVAVVNETGSESLEAFRGLGRRAPGLALMCAAFLLSLAGIPPLLGFFGKWLLFGSAIESGQVWLAIAGVVNSAIALYYYMNVIRLMYMVPADQQRPIPVALALRVALGICVAATVAFGLYPGPLLAAIAGRLTLSLL